ncbi:recombinase family protein [Planococcus shixiaomingii]|uniref:recombinase family protein n=1 Tax=Planococcus shixiaomingii TaxID=3058393 RepID=UPI00261ED320|nr:recombinase family protein [Planococcus sp. N022]WKA53437.1 recombinase family protein [Planococcus sp. N022]
MTMYAYIRCSTIDQNEARQIKTMKEHGVEKQNMFIDKLSGKNTDRPSYQKLKHIVIEGDTIIFDSISRLSRKYDDIKEEYKYYKNKGVKLKFVKEPMLDTPDSESDVIQVAISDIILSLLSAFAEKEREDIKIRQAEGIAIAKLTGKFKGRKTKLVEGGKEEQRMKAIIEAYKQGKSIKDIRITFKVGTGTIYRILEREGIER